MKILAIFLVVFVCSIILLMMPAEGAPSLLLCAVLASFFAFFISQAGSNRKFLLELFLSGLLVRLLVGSIIYAFHLQVFFGGDAFTYDFYGNALLKSWQGDSYYYSFVKTFVGDSGASGWGMLYMVASIYKLVGRNMLAVQFVNAVFGAATAPLIFICANHVFNNIKVARVAAYFVAFYPSLILWSAQGLKDGPIVFLLALSMVATLKLGEKLSLKYLLLLIFALFALLSMRFYIFYMMVSAVAGAFIIGMRAVTTQSIIRQFVVIVSVGLALTYLGVSRYASSQIETFGSLEAVELRRGDLAGSAESGFGTDVDVSTTGGALAAIPMGLVFLLFAPFPWQLVSLRQSITLPEMVVWWVAFPFLILGLWFSIKYRLRQVSPILIFTSLLTLGYSLFQGNIGTAYRQRSQLLVFYFIFSAVGFVLYKEKIDEGKRQKAAAALEEEKKRAIPTSTRRPAANI